MKRLGDEDLRPLISYQWAQLHACRRLAAVTGDQRPTQRPMWLLKALCTFRRRMPTA